MIDKQESCRNCKNCKTQKQKFIETQVALEQALSLSSMLLDELNKTKAM